MSRPYAQEIAFPGGSNFAVTNFDPDSVLGKGYTVDSPDEALAHFERIVQVTCSVCDKEAEGTAENLESQGFWLRRIVVCSVECLFELANKTGATEVLCKS